MELSTSDEEMDRQEQRYVTWTTFVTIELTTLAVPIIVAWALLTAHSVQPHAGAVRTHELSIISDQMRAMSAEMREIRSLLIQHSQRAPRAPWNLPQHTE